MVFAIAVIAVQLLGTTAAKAAPYVYDVHGLPRGGTQAVVSVEGRLTQPGEAREGSASPSSVSWGMSTTPPQDFVATNSVDDFVDLATPARRTHILDGDATGGGHLWPGLPGKTPFPQSWSGDRIMHEISDIATDPAAWSSGIPQGGRTVLTGVRDGVEIRVVVNTRTGEIITGTPTNLPRNP